MWEIIAIDIGNSRLKIRGEKIPLIAIDYHQESKFSLPITFSANTELFLSVSSVLVHHKTLVLIRQLMKDISPRNYQYKIWSSAEILKKALPKQYQNLNHLGCDRALKIYYLLNKFSTQDALSFNCGTAFTIEVVKSRQLVVSKILPGLTLQLQALHQYTDKLPLITAKQLQNILQTKDVLATDYAMVSGIIEGYQQLIIAELTELNTPVIICSGNYSSLVNQGLMPRGITLHHFENLETEVLLEIGRQLLVTNNHRGY